LPPISNTAIVARAAPITRFSGRDPSVNCFQRIGRISVEANFRVWRQFVNEIDDFLEQQ
jgi:hypothetical protein